MIYALARKLQIINWKKNVNFLIFLFFPQISDKKKNQKNWSDYTENHNVKISKSPNRESKLGRNSFKLITTKIRFFGVNTAYKFFIQHFSMNIRVAGKSHILTKSHIFFEDFFNFFLKNIEKLKKNVRFTRTYVLFQFYLGFPISKNFRSFPWFHNYFEFIVWIF